MSGRLSEWWENEKRKEEVSHFPFRERKYLDPDTLDLLPRPPACRCGEDAGSLLRGEQPVLGHYDVPRKFWHCKTCAGSITKIDLLRGRYPTLFQPESFRSKLTGQEENHGEGSDRGDGD